MEAIMKDNTSVLEADLDYAARMVLKGYGTAEQAAQADPAHTCPPRSKTRLTGLGFG